MYSSEHILKTRSPKYEGRPLSDSPISEDTTQIMLIFRFSGAVECGRHRNRKNFGPSIVKSSPRFLHTSGHFETGHFQPIAIGHFVGHIPDIFLHYTFHGFVAIIVAVSQY